MAWHTNNLAPAHEGYRYQNLVTAYAFVESLVHRYEAVIVDREVVEDDRIDDLEIVINQRRIRRQFKSSRDRTRRLGEKDFTGEKSSLRIDRLVQSYTRAGDDAADWRAERADEALVLVSVDFVSTSIAYGHSRDAIQQNLVTAVDIAARELRWPDIVRCVELHRSLHLAFEEKMNQPRYRVDGLQGPPHGNLRGGYAQSHYRCHDDTGHHPGFRRPAGDSAAACSA